MNVVVDGERSPGAEPGLRTPEAPDAAAEFRGDEERWRRLSAELEREKYGLDVMQAAFHRLLAVLRRFNGGWSFAMARQVRPRASIAAAPEEARVLPREAEAAIRVSLGEEHLAESMGGEVLGNFGMRCSSRWRSRSGTGRR